MKKQVLNLRPGTGTISASIDSLAARASTAVLTVAALGTAPTLAQAQDDAQDLAKKLSNPVAALISVPLQFNYDEGFGPNREGHKTYVNFQPVVPMSLNADWNVISRTIVPLIDQQNVVPGTSQSGIGDITQSFFFSPKAPTAGGMIWGIGPALLLPTGSDPLLSARKWGAGPTVVVLKQDHGWTYGALANHIWGFGGVETRQDVSSTFLQPFLSYTTPDAWTYTVNSESTYDWKNKEWTVPVNMMVSKLLKFGGQPVSLGVGARYWADSPESGPHGWGARMLVTFLFPK
ncbi:transporter [Variovorax sp.]|uniref:transporter n=1 Tax=Variovorax sp. TaxID=1871043 RepID=UPI002D4641C0|nr:transporter [Variovorax sp.]HYP83670.1 transporter [Variovorax sp.]